MCGVHSRGSETSGGSLGCVHVLHVLSLGKDPGGGLANVELLKSQYSVLSSWERG